LALAAAMLLTSCGAAPSGPSGKVYHSGDASAPTLHVGGADIIVTFPSAPVKASREALIEYLKSAAEAVTLYYAKFPVPRLSIDLSAKGGARVGGAEFDGNHIELEIGRDATDAFVAHDWVATHEMFHLAFPSLDDRYNWMNEGLSDYLEPIARAQAGTLTPDEVWRGFVEGMPQGQPEWGDRGLDNTHTWGRTYWGGCLYWLMADVRIREQTHGRKTVADALRAILAAGGDGGKTWELSRVFDVGDGATGTHVLRDLHAELGPKSVAVDLDALWKRLGISVGPDHVTFDANAPLAGFREAMTAREK
jgi:hypothetical protein